MNCDFFDSLSLVSLDLEADLFLLYLIRDCGSSLLDFNSDVVFSAQDVVLRSMREHVCALKGLTD